MIPLEYLAVLLAVIFALFTPKLSQYKEINLLLVAEFVLTIGIDEIILASGVYDGIWFDAYKLMFNLIFVALFLHLGGTMLAKISGMISIYHALLIFSPLFNSEVIYKYDYATIMSVFIVLQLILSFRGMLHGLCARRYHDIVWHGIDRRNRS